MSLISIPFNKRFVIEIASGRKTMTTRSKKYGKIGDTFYIRRKFPIIKCMLTGVEPILLKDVFIKFYKEEGFISPQKFAEFFRSLHPRISFNTKRKFYLHTFKRI